jgi:hypothetical protein
MDRREFLKSTAAAGAAAVLPFNFSTEKPEEQIPDAPFVENGHWVRPQAARALRKYRDVFDFDQLSLDRDGKAYAPELALLIENQNIINSVQVPLCDRQVTHDIDLQFVFNVYSRFIGRHLVSVQTMIGPADIVKNKRLRYNKADEAYTLYLEDVEVLARTTTVKTYYHPDDADFVANDLTRDIVRDLRNNVGTKLQCIEENLLSLVLHSSNMIHRKTLMGGADWILTSPEMWGLLQKQYPCACEECERTSLVIHKAGRLIGSRFTVYVDPLYPSRELLIGRRPNGCVMWNYDAGYLYCPYIPFMKRPDISGYPTNRLVTRYGKKMVDEGKGNRYYARLIVEG